MGEEQSSMNRFLYLQLIYILIPVKYSHVISTTFCFSMNNSQLLSKASKLQESISFSRWVVLWNMNELGVMVIVYFMDSSFSKQTILIAPENNGASFIRYER